MHRYKSEVSRLYKVLDTQLRDQEFVAGDYSIADIAIWPWIARHEWQEQDLDDYPEVKRWFAAVENRPAVQRALEIGKDWADFSAQLGDEEKARLFNIRQKDFK